MFAAFAATISRKFAGLGGGQAAESVLKQVLQAQSTEQLISERQSFYGIRLTASELTRKPLTQSEPSDVAR